MRWNGTDVEDRNTQVVKQQYPLLIGSFAAIGSNQDNQPVFFVDRTKEPIADDTIPPGVGIISLELLDVLVDVRLDAEFRIDRRGKLVIDISLLVPELPIKIGLKLVCLKYLKLLQ